VKAKSHQVGTSVKTIEIETIVEELESRGYQTLYGILNLAPFEQSSLLEEKLTGRCCNEGHQKKEPKGGAVPAYFIELSDRFAKAKNNSGDKAWIKLWTT
jgi:hypothetical protein